MIKFILSIFVFSFFVTLQAQSVPEKLNTAWQNFMADGQLQYSMAGICVMDAQTGKIIFGRNENIGMAPASTQKIFTSVAAFEALGKDYRYQTNIGYTGNKMGRKLLGDLIVEGSGDPTFGSFRYSSTKGNAQIATIASALKQNGIDTIAGKIIESDKGFDLNPVPQDWMWGDMGNYYGAGHWALNWAENQYDIHLSSGASGSLTTIKKIDIEDQENIKFFHNEVISGDANTGDGTIIYTAPFSPFKVIQGEISSNRSNFPPISGSFSFADRNALTIINDVLKAKGVVVSGNIQPISNRLIEPDSMVNNIKASTHLVTIMSPSLDSIVYWFLKKSINLYGEGLLRTIGLEKEGFGSTQNGLKWIDSFYTTHIDIRAKHMRDGSGLSPTNRVTPTALVLALQLAKTKNWFPYFYDALPSYNGMKLKSGTIHRTKCYAGYHTSKDGKQYIVSLMVNNYNGDTSSLVEKMFTILDILK